MKKLHMGLLLVVGLMVQGACLPAVENNPVVPSATGLSPPRQGSIVVPSAFGLSATLQMPASLPDGDMVKIQFTLTNDSDADLYVLKWYTPLEGIGGEIFRVERDGQAVPYTGILAMRGDPMPEGYQLLEAGQSASAEVDLASSFDFSQPGECTIGFLSPRISRFARSEAEMARSVDDLGPVDIPANTVTVVIGGSSGEPVETAIGDRALPAYLAFPTVQPGLLGSPAGAPGGRGRAAHLHPGDARSVVMPRWADGDLQVQRLDPDLSRAARR